METHSDDSATVWIAYRIPLWIELIFNLSPSHTALLVLRGVITFVIQTTEELRERPIWTSDVESQPLRRTVAVEHLCFLLALRCSRDRVVNILSAALALVDSISSAMLAMEELSSASGSSRLSSTVMVLQIISLCGESVEYTRGSRRFSRRHFLQCAQRVRVKRVYKA